ncbi:MAG TPA: methylated-DNA--[protein]-cysteine S-methyltransferase [Streptosporangiaceae bacterium]|nr:methylated-DNA--[protein]-cysteine S-methyltransferase [Streptosporangiaceae bacterium]
MISHGSEPRNGAVALDAPDADGRYADGPATDGRYADGPHVEGPHVDGPATDGPHADSPDTDGTATSASAMRSLEWAVIDAPVGPVSVGCSEVGVASVRFGPPPAGAVTRSPDPADGLLGSARAQLNSYFLHTETVFGIALDWGNCSSSRRAVLSLLAETVGFGQTVTYGALARRLSLRDGRPDIGARAIGSIMGSNPIPIIVPCHRVVAADGLGGFSGGCGIELKRWLLTFEGALPEMLDFGEPQRPASLSSPRPASLSSPRQASLTSPRRASRQRRE